MAFAYKTAAIEYTAQRSQNLQRRSRVAECFVVFEIVSQLALLVPTLGSERSLIRASAFGASLLLLVAVGVRRRRHPASRAAMLVFAVVALSMLNTMRNSWMSALAQLFLYVAIMAPLFWVPALRIDGEVWYRVLFILWVFHSLSAATGVLQVCFPGHFTPNLSTAVAARGWDFVQSLMITTNTGERALRPMGLTDLPGVGAANAGLYAVSLGLVFFVLEKRTWLRVVFVTSMAVGLAAIALSQVRTTLVMTAICLSTFFVLLQIRNVHLSGRRTHFGDRIARANIALAAAAIAVMVILGSTIALSLANRSVSGRIGTLFEQDPGQVYYSNRGFFLEETVRDLLPKFPFGAGPGRWGMISTYFGDPSNLVNPPIWAEIQWTGWVLDGGIPLVLAYVFAISLAFTFSLKIALGRNAREVGVFGAFVFAYNIGAFAQTFDSPFFMGQDGMLFWFMNAILYAAALESSRRGVRKLPW